MRLPNPDKAKAPPPSNSTPMGVGLDTTLSKVIEVEVNTPAPPKVGVTPWPKAIPGIDNMDLLGSVLRRTAPPSGMLAAYQHVVARAARGKWPAERILPGVAKGAKVLVAESEVFNIPVLVVACSQKQLEAFGSCDFAASTHPAIPFHVIAPHGAFRNGQLTRSSRHAFEHEVVHVLQAIRQREGRAGWSESIEDATELLLARFEMEFDAYLVEFSRYEDAYQEVLGLYGSVMEGPLTKERIAMFRGYIETLEALFGATVVGPDHFKDAYIALLKAFHGRADSLGLSIWDREWWARALDHPHMARTAFQLSEGMRNRMVTELGTT